MVVGLAEGVIGNNSTHTALAGIRGGLEGGDGACFSCLLPNTACRKIELISWLC